MRRTTPTYASDPDRAPDTDYAPGHLGHLVPGNRGRLLDVRRTPVTITAVRLDRGAFELRIDAFEDAGALWELPLDHVSRFQFPTHAAIATAVEHRALKRTLTRVARALEITTDPGRRAHTLERLASERASLAERLSGEPAALAVDLATHIARREGSPALTAQLESLLNERGLTDIDGDVARAFVSNPESGEVVKGHAIVVAELGLCPYRGTVVRDPALFEEPWTKERRAEHVITRMAFVQSVFGALGRASVVLFRGASSEQPFGPSAPRSFVSATFAESVACEHYAGGESTHTAVLWRQRVPVERMLMTFLETAAMNASFREAEAVLIGDPGSPVF